MTVSDVLDREELMQRIDDDLELLHELIELFVEDYPLLLNDINEGLAHSDAQRVKIAAHTLKGAVGNFCAQAAFDAAFVLEVSGNNGDLSQGREQLLHLESEMEKVLSALQSLQSECANSC